MGQSLEDYVHGLLNEEAGEICQEIGKALRFGMDTRSPIEGRYAGTTPRQRLYNETADMEAAVLFAKECGFTGGVDYQARVEEKLRRHRDPEFRAMTWIPALAVARAYEQPGEVAGPAVSATETNANERLQAIIDWADLALANPAEFNSHGVRNLDGPVFDEARAFLAGHL